MIKRVLVLACCVALGAGLAACGGDDDDGGGASMGAATAPMETETAPATDGESAGDIVAVASATPELSTLTRAVTAAGLVETLQGEGPFTVFAPTDDAFGAVDPAQLRRLLQPEGRRALTDVLTYHVFEGSAMAADLRDGQMLETVNGARLEVAVDGDAVTVGGASVTQADVPAANGVVHVIDAVLMPPS